MLIHGDCLDVLPTLPDASVDMVFADLPYGVTANPWDTVVPLEPLWDELSRISKSNAAFIFTATQPFATTLICSQPTMFRYDLVWIKHNPSSGAACKIRPLRYHEIILVFYKKKPTYNPQMTARDSPRRQKNKPRRQSGINKNTGNLRAPLESYDFTDTVYPRSYLQHFNIARCKAIHPTQKPVALLEWLIRTYTHEGDIVLDPTCGSGTTAIAAMNTNRKWVCIEKDSGYHAVAAKRIAEHQAAPKQTTLAL